MGKKLSLSEATKDAIAAFYLSPHTLNETVREFGLSCRQIVKKILAEKQIDLHDRATTLRLTEENAKHSLKSKYGVTNAFSVESVKSQCAEKHTTQLPSETVSAIVAFYQSPNSEAKTAREFNLSRTVIHRILIENRVAFHDRTTSESLREAELERTCLERYGVDAIGKSSSLQAKAKRTCWDRYGADKPFRSDRIRDKAKATCLARYGHENPFSYEGTRKKIKETCVARYGVEWYQQTDEARAKARKAYTIRKDWLIARSRESRARRYVAEDLAFDSLPELAFFVCCLEDGLHIEREPCSFTYEWDGKLHKYFPDFRLNGELIEIKGDHFLKEDRTWQNPFDHSKDGLWEAKRKCALDHGVKILYSADYASYVDRFLAAHDLSEFE